MSRPARALGLAGLVAVLLAACSSPSPTHPAASAGAGFTAHGSVDGAYVLGAEPGESLTVRNATGTAVGTAVADHDGNLVFWNLAPGPGYTVVGTGGASTGRFSVLDGADPPPESFYSRQHMHAGLNYITMRDGVELAATVRLPPGETLSNGPFPTVIEYSGYAVAAPGNLLSAELGSSSGNPALLPDSSTVVGSVITPLLGFATVSLQMRGTGCSGGAFDLFGPQTTYDGYDAVQIVAGQPWVKGHKVGMVGISYSGISQLFVAGTDPPGLAAIAPLSVTNDLYSTGYPGGIYNSGFAGSWLAAREQDAEAAPGGEPYAEALIAGGDRQCAANQAMHLATPQLSTIIGPDSYRSPSLFDVRSPELWARKIKVPVFLAGAFQDEQTGGQWPALVPGLAHDSHVFVTMLNGTHIDSLGPGTITRWVEFLDLFVADELPNAPSDFDLLADQFYGRATDAPTGPLPALRFTHARSVADARAEYERSTPRVRVLFDNGGGSAGPGALQPVWEVDLRSWPPPDVVPTYFYLGEHGALATSRAGVARGTVGFEPNPAARPATDLSASANAWAALPPYEWEPIKGSTGVGFVTTPLRRDVVVIGPASLDLRLESSAPDTDLQVTISEVLPDGKEMFVQTGELRADDRALAAAASTALDPVPTYLVSKARPMPRGAFVEVRIPIPPFAFAFRKGSRIRVTVEAPGDDRPAWAFATTATHGKVRDTIELGGSSASVLVLGVTPRIVPPDPQPACPSLRGEPCRTYLPAGNGG